MEAHLRTLMGILSLTCLLQPAFSGIKSRLILKVPHRVKHIHITHFKPVHIHTMESKKVVHQHHEDEVKVSHKELEGKQEEKRSFSNINPIVWQPHPEVLKEQEGLLPFSQEHELIKSHYKKSKNDFSKTNYKQLKPPISYKRENWNLPSPIFQNGPGDADSEIANSNVDWRFEGDGVRNKNNHGFSRGFRQNKNLKTTNVVSNHGESDWKPMMNFHDLIGFPDEVNNAGRLHGDHYFDSEKYDLQNNNEENKYSKTNIDFENTKKTEQQRNSQNKKNKGQRSHQSHQNYKKDNIFLPQRGITHKQPLSNLKDGFHSFLDPSSLMYLKEALLRDIEPENPQTSSFQQKPSLIQNQQVYPLKLQVHQPHDNVKGPPQQVKQQERQNKKKHIKLEAHQQTHQEQNSKLKVPQQEWNQEQNSKLKVPQQEWHQEQNSKLKVPHQEWHQEQNSKLRVPQQEWHLEQNSKLRVPQQEWHQEQNSKLRVPQQEWHQQNIHQQINLHQQSVHQQAHQEKQQSIHGQVLPAPVQEFTVIHKPPLVHKSPLSSTSLIKPHAPQRVLPVHEGNPHQGKVRQQWHQSVQTSGKDGTGSSYKVEVINYSPTEKVAPGM